MKPADFRKLALSLPEAVESAHMGHPDFRVNKRIFASVFTRDNVEFGMVKLKPEQQREFVKADPQVFEPVAGGWGRGGATQVNLKTAKKRSLRLALFTAWFNIAPKRLINLMEDENKS